MSLLILNKAVFMHAHIMADGTIVAHAHPYDKSDDSKPFKTHHHTTAGLLFFQNLTILFFAAFLIYIFSDFYRKTLLSVNNTVSYISFLFTRYNKRAPPVL